MTESEVATLAAILVRVESSIESLRSDFKEQIKLVHRILLEQYVTADQLTIALANQEKALLAHLDTKNEKDPVRMAVLGAIKYIVIGFLGAVISRHIQ